MLTGVAEQLDGLYFLRGMEFAGVMQQAKQVSLDVWHHRLGHPSSRILDLLPISVLSSDNDLQNKACETCVHAKQTRCFFPTSSNKATDLFEIVH